MIGALFLSSCQSVKPEATTDRICPPRPWVPTVQPHELVCPVKNGKPIPISDEVYVRLVDRYAVLWAYILDLEALCDPPEFSEVPWPERGRITWRWQ